MDDDEQRRRLIAALRVALATSSEEASSQQHQEQQSSSKMALIRAPGRVNLIGEHIDYHGYPVLPLALEQSVTIAVGKKRAASATSGGVVTVLNLDQARYPGTHVLPLTTAAAAAAAEELSWTDYVRCALCGVCARFPSAAQQQQLDGLVLVVHGTIPPAAGLSSSSALVVASALAVLWGLGVSMGPTDVAALCIECERLIGTAGGGMDQSASIMAEAGRALFIDFSPALAATPVPLPEDAVFVVANSLVVAEKAKAAYAHYNLRVVEGRLALALLGKALGVEDWRSLRTLWALEQALPTPGALTPDVIRAHLHPGAYTLPELHTALETETNDGIVATVLPDRRGAAALVLAHNAEFKLRDRALHVVEEARRVRAFRRICEEEGESGSDAGGGATAASLDRLGALMDASHESCRALYECSHPELDALVAICRSAPGAKGSRLTGAGWGGCCVSLVAGAEVGAFVERVWQEYYVKRRGLGGGGGSEDGRGRCLFVTRPAPGASVEEVELPFQLT